MMAAWIWARGAALLVCALKAVVREQLVVLRHHVTLVTLAGNAGGGDGLRSWRSPLMMGTCIMSAGYLHRVVEQNIRLYAETYHNRLAHGLHRGSLQDVDLIDAAPAPDAPRTGTTACSLICTNSSSCASPSFLESFKYGRVQSFGRITAPAATGPARGLCPLVVTADHGAGRGQNILASRITPGSASSFPAFHRLASLAILIFSLYPVQSPGFLQRDPAQPSLRSHLTTVWRPWADPALRPLPGRALSRHLLNTWVYRSPQRFPADNSASTPGYLRFKTFATPAPAHPGLKSHR